MTSRIRTAFIGAGTILALLTVASVASASAAKAPRVDVVASYTHPEPNPGYSWVCVRVKGTLTTRLKVTVSGGHVLGLRTKSSTIRRASGVIVRFKINMPAGYVFRVVGTLGGAKTTKRAEVNVPQPPPSGIARGPFSCV
jgi:hypothetical protein